MSAEKRVAPRVECEVPVRIASRVWTFSCTAVDLSRTGMRVRMDLNDLRLHRLAGLVAIARQVQAVLPEEVTARFHPGVPGPAVERSVRVARIVQRDWSSSKVELGCVFASPLSTREGHRVGLELPAIQRGVESTAAAGGSLTDAARRDESCAAAPVPTSHRLRVFVEPREGGAGRCYMGEPRHVDPRRIVLRATGLEGIRTLTDVAAFIVSFDEVYGTEAQLRFLDGNRTLFEGTARLREAELVPNTIDEILLGYTMDDVLSDDQLKLFETTPAA